MSLFRLKKDEDESGKVRQLYILTAAALRAYQAAVDATKSPQREAYTLWDAAYEGDQRMKSV